MGATRASRPFVHYPQERWFAPTEDGSWPVELLNPALHAFYNPEGDIDSEVLVDLNSGNVARGICALPYTRLRDGAQTWIPVNIIGNQGLARSRLRHSTRAALPAPGAVIARHPGIIWCATLRGAGAIR